MKIFILASENRNYFQSHVTLSTTPSNPFGCFSRWPWVVSSRVYADSHSTLQGSLSLQLSYVQYASLSRLPASSPQFKEIVWLCLESFLQGQSGDLICYLCPLLPNL